MWKPNEYSGISIIDKRIKEFAAIAEENTDWSLKRGEKDRKEREKESKAHRERVKWGNTAQMQSESQRKKR